MTEIGRCSRGGMRSCFFVCYWLVAMLAIWMRPYRGAAAMVAARQLWVLVETGEEV